MADIILMTGNVNFKITLDPSVWIFDDRKIDLTTYFDKTNETRNLESASKTPQVKNTPENGERPIREAASMPPVRQSINKFQKKQLMDRSFGMPFRPFIEHAEPHKDATTLTIETSTSGQYDIPLEKAFDGILGFSDNGKFLINNGPAHFYYNDGSNKDTPITHIEKFVIR